MPTQPLTSTVRRRTVILLATLVFVQLCLLVVYFAVRGERPAVLRYTLYPILWITLSVAVALHVDVPDASRRQRTLATTVAGVYFVGLLALSGLLGVPGEELLQTVGPLDVQAGSPGTERLHLVTEVFYLSIVPYRTIGFLVLAYLVYLTVLDVSGTLAAGALGLLTCVGCAFPVLVSLSTALFGSTAVASAVYGAQFDISTAVFVLAVGLLYWRPGVDGTVGSLRGDRV